MQLKPITFQNPDDKDLFPLYSQFYESRMDFIIREMDGTDSMRQEGEQILRFIQILESEFSGPPQWMTTSHMGVSFRDRDYESYSDTPIEDGGITLTVRYDKDESGAWQFLLSSGAERKTPPTNDAAEAAAAAAKILNEIS